MRHALLFQPVYSEGFGGTISSIVVGGWGVVGGCSVQRAHPDLQWGRGGNAKVNKTKKKGGGGGGEGSSVVVTRVVHGSRMLSSKL